MKRTILWMRKILPPTLIALVLSIIIASVGTVSLTPTITQADPETTVYLDPPTITGLTIGEEFTVNIMIRDAPDMNGWQTGLTFNPDLLRCTSFSQGEFLRVSPEGTVWVSGTIDNTAGVITAYGCAIKGEYYASDDGRLAYANFTVKAPGVSDLHLQDVKPTSWKYVDDTVEPFPIPTNIIDVYTAVVGTTPHTVVIVSNSTGKDQFVVDSRQVIVGSGFSGHSFNLTLKEVGFNVTGPYPGFSRVTIPKALLPPPVSPRVWAVVVNGTARIIEAPTDNLTHTFLYFTYPARLNSIQITTRFMSSTISMTLSKDSIPLGESVTISGNVTAADLTMRPNVPVTISYRLKGVAAWTTVDTTTDSNGIYTYDWEPETSGTYEVKASWPGDVETLGDETSVKTLKVGGERFPLEIVIAVVVVIIVIAAIVVYLVKFRKK